ncbi:palindromic element RPE2 domain-containing protein [Rickettsia endosymbiont of Halotydeus destructor]
MSQSVIYFNYIINSVGLAYKAREAKPIKIGETTSNDVG